MSWPDIDLLRRRRSCQRMVRAKRREMKAQDGSKVSGGSEWCEISVLDYFLMTFPMEYLPKIVQLTSESLASAGEKTITASELLQFSYFSYL